jgi:Cof subfamily protein (haloacid dehalogenase superfamily)
VTATRLVAIDLDGTLIGEDLRVSNADRAAIEQATGAGIELCIATGRIFSAGRPFAEELGLTGYLIPLNGAAVFEVRTAEMVRAVPLDVDVARRALDELRASGFRVQLYFGDHLYLDGTDERARKYEQLSRVEPILVPDLLELLNGKAPAEPGPMKVLGIGTQAQVLEQISALRALFGSKANVFRSLPEYLEITNPAADKGTALAWVAAQRGIDRTEVAAIGDSDNDVPMLQWAGRSYAVANGTALAKAAAGTVVGARGTGVAEALADVLAGAACERT